MNSGVSLMVGLCVAIQCVNDTNMLLVLCCSASRQVLVCSHTCLKQELPPLLAPWLTLQLDVLLTTLVQLY